MRPPPRCPGGLLALLVAALLVTVPTVTGTTSAAFSDTAPITTGVVGAGVFVPPPANGVGCATSSGNTVITFTTARVTPEPPRSYTEYVGRLYRTNTTPAALVGGPYVMDVGATNATFVFNGGGLTLLQNTPYQFRVTTRLNGSTRESSPERTRNFTDSGLLVRSFTCGAGN